jgi:hypothetical protein
VFTDGSRRDVVARTLGTNKNANIFCRLIKPRKANGCGLPEALQNERSIKLVGFHPKTPYENEDGSPEIRFGKPAFA